MMARSWIAYALLALATLFVATASPARAQNVWTVDMDSANHKGTQTTTVTVTYDDQNQVKQTKTISVTSDIPANTTAAQKKALVKAKLDAAIAETNNQVGGQPLVTTGGLGDTIQLQPATATGNPPPFTNAKIKKVETKDKETNEKDTITPPNQSGTALGTIEAIGDITGLTEESTPAVFSVETAVGVITVNLTATMTRLALLEELAEGIAAQGFTVWVDSDKLLLLVTLPPESGGLAAGCSDAQLEAVASVQIR